MKYKIALYQTDEGFSVSAPGLPGCWSQGDTEAEALANIEAAIQEYLSVVDQKYLSVVDELLEGAEVRKIDMPG